MRKPAFFKPIGGAVTALLDPMLAKRSHVDAALALAWPELCGEKLAGKTQPLKVTWPRRADTGDPFQPGVLAIACEGATALDLQYSTTELISRINGFFGYAAIHRIRIEQRPIDQFRPTRKKLGAALPEPLRQGIERQVESISDEGLRRALERLGSSVKLENLNR